MNNFKIQSDFTMKSPIKCYYCELTYSRRQNMIRHLKVVHKDVKHHNKPIFKQKNVIATKSNAMARKNNVQDKIQTIQMPKFGATRARTTRNSKGLRRARHSIRIYNAVDPRYIQQIRKINAKKKRLASKLRDTAENEHISIPCEPGTCAPESREDFVVAPAEPNKIFTPEEFSTISDEIYSNLHGISSPIEALIVVNEMLYKYLQHDNEKLLFLKRLNVALKQVK